VRSTRNDATLSRNEVRGSLSRVPGTVNSTRFTPPSRCSRRTGPRGGGAHVGGAVGWRMMKNRAVEARSEFATFSCAGSPDSSRRRARRQPTQVGSVLRSNDRSMIPPPCLSRLAFAAVAIAGSTTRDPGTRRPRRGALPTEAGVSLDPPRASGGTGRPGRPTPYLVPSSRVLSAPVCLIGLRPPMLSPIVARADRRARPRRPVRTQGGCHRSVSAESRDPRAD
jgi:hypothetical protein